MPHQPVVIRGRIKLKHFAADFFGGRNKGKTKARTKALARRIGALQELLYANARHAVLLIFQGLDASGKDSVIRRVLRHVNPTGAEVANFRVPSAEEKAHDFLWRVH